MMRWIARTLVCLFMAGFSACGVGNNGFLSGPIYSISGTIAENGVGLADVMVTLSGDGMSTITDASGNYSFPHLSNGTYSITPSRTGYTFTPTSKLVIVNDASLLGQDFNASAAPGFSYTISGTITENAAGLAGVTVALSPSVTTITDASGNYSLSHLPNGTYTVTPSKSGYTFSPMTRTATVNNGDVPGQDFTANAIAGYTVSGTITSSSIGIQGVTVTLSSSATTTTDASGNYSFPGITAGVYTITPSKSGYIFTPTLKSVTVNSGNVSGQDFIGNNESHVFAKLAGPTLWTSLVRTIAIDSQNQVYVTNGSTIFRINSSGAASYVDGAAVAAAIGGSANASSLYISGIDVGPDDKLYILEGTYRKILVSAAAGSVAVHRDLSGIFGFPRYIGVVASDNILLVNLYDGLWSIKASGNTNFDNTVLRAGTGCATENIAARYDGAFAYMPGCNQSPVMGGLSDGSGIGILLTNSINLGIGYYYNFSGIGRSPAGGYILNIGGQRIGRLSTTGQLELVYTDPQLDALAQQMNDNFYYGSIGEGPTGNIFVVSSTAVYVAK